MQFQKCLLQALQATSLVKANHLVTLNILEACFAPVVLSCVYILINETIKHAENRAANVGGIAWLLAGYDRKRQVRSLWVMKRSV